MERLIATFSSKHYYNTKQFTENCANMDLDSLKKLRDDMQKQASEVLPVTSQIKASATHKSHNNNDFII